MTENLTIDLPGGRKGSAEFCAEKRGVLQNFKLCVSFACFAVKIFKIQKLYPDKRDIQNYSLCIILIFLCLSDRLNRSDNTCITLK